VDVTGALLSRRAVGPGRVDDRNLRPLPAGPAIHGSKSGMVADHLTTERDEQVAATMAVAYLRMSM
jgi:hypothetical protein